MSNIKVVYWSQTGNTEAMAEAVGEGIREGGCEAEVLSVSGITPDQLKDETAFALGCPAMGAETLEEDEMEPFVEVLEGLVSGKKIALFGSYDWGDGEWMRDWVSRMQNAGADIAGGEGLICNLTPGETELAACRKLGKELAEM